MDKPVVISDRAAEEIQAAYDWWAEYRSLEQAVRWYNGILDHIEGLALNPIRCAKANESSRFPFEVRESHFGLGRRASHRILFTIRPECIYIMAVRHVSQAPLGPDDLP
jgi:plasmid stabilization system protein ParE